MLLGILTQAWLIAWLPSAPIFPIHKLDVRKVTVESPAAIPHTVFSPMLESETALSPSIWWDERLLRSDAILSRLPRQLYLEIGIDLFNEVNPKPKTRSQTGTHARKSRPAGLLLAKALSAGSRFTVSSSKFSLAVVSSRPPPSNIS